MTHSLSSPPSIHRTSRYPFAIHPSDIKDQTSPRTLTSQVHPFIHSLIQSFTHSFIHSSIHSFIHSLIHSSIHSFIRPSIHSFTHSSIHSFPVPMLNKDTWLPLNLVLCAPIRHAFSAGWMEGWMDGRMEGYTDGWMNGWMDGWNSMSYAETEEHQKKGASGPRHKNLFIFISCLWRCR